MEQEQQKTSRTADFVFKGLATFGFMVLLAALVWGGVIVAKKANPALSSLSSVVVTVLSFGVGDEGDTASTTPVETVAPTTTPPTPTPPVTAPVVTKPTTTTKPATTLTPGKKTETTYTYTQTTTGAVIDPKGFADLVPTVVSVGYMDINNEFVADASPATAYNRKLAVKYVVENKGVNSSGSWYMNVVLPTQPYHIFTSDMLQNLNPGEKIEFVIAFTQPKAGAASVTINVDPTCTDNWCSGIVKESNEKNNILKYDFTIRPASA